jgi:hypothetical protein
MPASRNVKTKCDGQVRHDWTGGTLIIDLDPGDFSWSVPDAAVEIFLQRGKIGNPPLIRRGDEAPMTFTYSKYLSDLGAADASYATLPDSVYRYPGNYAQATFNSTLTGTDAVTNTTIYTISGTATGEADKSLEFPYSTLRADGGEGIPSTMTVNGTSHAATPTYS